MHFLPHLYLLSENHPHLFLYDLIIVCPIFLSKLEAHVKFCLFYEIFLVLSPPTLLPSKSRNHRVITIFDLELIIGLIIVLFSLLNGFP